MEQQTSRASSSVKRDRARRRELCSHTHKTPLSAQSPKSGKRRILLQILLGSIWPFDLHLGIGKLQIGNFYFLVPNESSCHD